MKKILYALSIIFGGLFISCNNDLDLTADWKDIPVVYGILSINNSTHYLRIEKAFLDPATGAYELAKIPDSLYYADARVELVRVSNGAVFPLTRVDGNLEGLVRDTGVFANAPNYLYKISNSQINLQGGEEMELRIYRGENLPPATARTIILPQMDFQQNRPPGLISRWNQQVPVRVGWRPNSDNAQFFDIEISMAYDETLPDMPGITNKTITWKPFVNYPRPEGSSFVDASIESDPFYQFVGSSIPVIPGAKRAFRGLTFTVIGGGREIYDFVNLTLAGSSSVTSAQDAPVYSNVDGGVGIFTSSSRVSQSGVGLATEARDSLIFGRYTKDLGFQ